jgi:hypothetical protein
MSAGQFPRRHGARVFQHGDDAILVVQTVKSGTAHNDEYQVEPGRQRFVNPTDDAAIGEAIRSALAGNL